MFTTQMIGRNEPNHWPLIDKRSLPNRRNSSNRCGEKSGAPNQKAYDYCQLGNLISLFFSLSSISPSRRHRLIYFFVRPAIIYFRGCRLLHLLRVLLSGYPSNLNPPKTSTRPLISRVRETPQVGLKDAYQINICAEALSAIPRNSKSKTFYFSLS